MGGRAQAGRAGSLTVSDEPEPDDVSGSPTAAAERRQLGARRPAAGRGGLILGGVLIVLGVLFLAERAFGVQLGRFGWPLFVIVPGVPADGREPGGVGGREGSGLAVAGAITTVVGLVLAFQNATGLWATWAYAWALVGPGATGLGLHLLRRA